MQIELHRLKNVAKDIKQSWGEPNDSHTRAEYNGKCKGLDMIVNHFQEIIESEIDEEYEKWKWEEFKRIFGHKF